MASIRCAWSSFSAITPRVFPEYDRVPFSSNTLSLPQGAPVSSTQSHWISSPGSCSISIVGPGPRRLTHASQRGRSLRRRTSRANVT
jgi:hypothetical protein